MARVLSRSQSPPRDLSREQTSLWFAGYPNADVLRRRELGRLFVAKSRVPVYAVCNVVLKSGRTAQDDQSIDLNHTAI
jgi:hypothetical protein